MGLVHRTRAIRAMARSAFPENPPHGARERGLCLTCRTMGGSFRNSVSHR